jgi:hypothetical protein
MIPGSTEEVGTGFDPTVHEVLDMRSVVWIAVLPLLIPFPAPACRAGDEVRDAACCGGRCSCPGTCSMTCDEPPADVVAVPPNAPAIDITVDEARGLPHARPAAPTTDLSARTKGCRVGRRLLFLLDCALLR